MSKTSTFVAQHKGIVGTAVAIVIIWLISSSGQSADLTTTTTSPTQCGLVIVASQARDCIGENSTVDFFVAKTYTDSAGTEFLDQNQNYKTGFVVVIEPSDLGTFNFDPALDCMGQEIQVAGQIAMYNGYVEILNPYDISIVQPDWPTPP